MKYLRVVIAVFLVLSFVACGDDEEPVQEASVVGEWSLASQDVRNVVATIQGGVTVPINDNLLPGVEEVLDTINVFPEDATLTFTEDQTYSISDPSLNETLEGTWILDTDARTLTMTGLDQASQFIGANALTFNVETLTDSRLSLFTSMPDISLESLGEIPEAELLAGATISGDYQLDLQK